MLSGGNCGQNEHIKSILFEGYNSYNNIIISPSCKDASFPSGTTSIDVYNIALQVNFLQTQRIPLASTNEALFTYSRTYCRPRCWGLTYWGTAERGKPGIIGALSQLPRIDQQHVRAVLEVHGGNQSTGYRCESEDHGMGRFRCVWER